jgi:hypothetical protein
MGRGNGDTLYFQNGLQLEKITQLGDVLDCGNTLKCMGVKK